MINRKNKVTDSNKGESDISLSQFLCGSCVQLQSEFGSVGCFSGGRRDLENAEKKTLLTS